MALISRISISSVIPSIATGALVGGLFTAKSCFIGYARNYIYEKTDFMESRFPTSEREFLNFLIPMMQSEVPTITLGEIAAGVTAGVVLGATTAVSYNLAKGILGRLMPLPAYLNMF